MIYIENTRSVYFDIKLTRQGFENIERLAERFNKAFLKAEPGKLDIKRHSPSTVFYLSFYLLFHSSN